MEFLYLIFLAGFYIFRAYNKNKKKQKETAERRMRQQQFEEIPVEREVVHNTSPQQSQTAAPKPTTFKDVFQDLMDEFEGEKQEEIPQPVFVQTPPKPKLQPIVKPKPFKSATIRKEITPNVKPNFKRKKKRHPLLQRMSLRDMVAADAILNNPFFDSKNDHV